MRQRITPSVTFIYEATGRYFEEHELRAGKGLSPTHIRHFLRAIEDS
jgi:hypothetical protein